MGLNGAKVTRLVAPAARELMSWVFANVLAPLTFKLTVILLSGALLEFFIRALTECGVLRMEAILPGAWIPTTSISLLYGLFTSNKKLGRNVVLTRVVGGEVVPAADAQPGFSANPSAR